MIAVLVEVIDLVESLGDFREVLNTLSAHAYEVSTCTTFFAF